MLAGRNEPPVSGWAGDLAIRHQKSKLHCGSLAGASVNRAAEIVSLLIAGFAVALIGWAILYLSSPPTHPNESDQRAVPSRLRKWLNA